MPETGRRTNQTGEAAMRLAQRFRDMMEYLDPTGSGEWGELSRADQEFYRDVVLAVLDDEELVLSALKEAHQPQHS